VQRIVGRVQVEHDLARRRSLRLQKNLHQQSVHRFHLQRDLLVALFFLPLGRSQLQPVQCTLARQRLAPVAPPGPALAPRIRLLGQYCQQRVAPQLLVVVQVFVTERQRVDSLRDQPPCRVLHLPRRPMVPKTFRKTLNDPRPLFHLPQQQATPIGADRTTVKPPHDLPPIQRMKFEGLLVTLGSHKAVASPEHKCFSSKILMPEVTAFFNFPVRNTG
jgi:hypothetical protein